MAVTSAGWVEVLALCVHSGQNHEVELVEMVGPRVDFSSLRGPCRSQVHSNLFHSSLTYFHSHPGGKACIPPPGDPGRSFGEQKLCRQRGVGVTWAVPLVLPQGSPSPGQVQSLRSPVVPGLHVLLQGPSREPSPTLLQTAPRDVPLRGSWVKGAPPSQANAGEVWMRGWVVSSVILNTFRSLTSGTFT